MRFAFRSSGPVVAVERLVLRERLALGLAEEEGHREAAGVRVVPGGRVGDDRVVVLAVGFSRIVVSEIEVPNMR